MPDPIWVTPVVSSAKVATDQFCESCSAVMVRLTIGGLHDQGTVQLPDILICPDHFDVKRVVDEWRSKLQVKKQEHPTA